MAPHSALVAAFCRHLALFLRGSPEYAEALGDIAATYDHLGRPDDARRYRVMQQQTVAADNIGAAGRLRLN